MPELFTQPIFIDNEGFKLDEAGSLIAGVHIDADKAYSELPDLLQKFINTQNEEVWSEIEKKIDYIYSGIFIMLNYLDEETNFMCKLQEEVKKNKILLFKPNIMSPDCISGYNHGAGSAYSLATKWPMVAAIMRWFHDNGNINYSQMGLIEGCNDLIASICNKTFSSQINKIITNEGILEGRVEGLVDGEIKTFDGGWGFYYVRKYLSSHCSQDESDNPMNGYEESCNGILLAPGEAKNKLMIYDINTLQEVPSRKSIFLEKFSLAFKLSQQENQEKDLFYNKMIYAKGYWPSFKTVEYLYNMTYVYGGQSLKSISLSSPYGCLFQYCDIVKNSGNYTKNPSTALSDYFKDLNSGEKPLPFTFFVPHGFGKLNGIKVPNTIETNDPKLIFTAHFKEIW